MKLLSTLITSWIVLFDDIQKQKNTYKRFAVYIAIALFVAHITAIFLVNMGIINTAHVPFIQKGYLSTIFTPFSIILLYEVFVLILAVPTSMIHSIAKQFEIVTLILLWNSLKDLATLKDIDVSIQNDLNVITSVAIDLGGALIMFATIGLFYQISRRTSHEHIQKHAHVLTFEKLLSLMLVFVFIALLIIDVTIQLDDVMETRQMIIGSEQFFQNIFTLMIFVDILSLLLAFLYTSSFHVLFAYGAFVISAVLLRLSLSISTHTQVIIASGSMIFSLVVIALYHFVYVQMSESKQQ